MFTNSSSYLGGPSGRPGQQQYGQQQPSYGQQQPPYGQQQQQQSLQPQPTGFGGQPSPFGQPSPMQPQYTGMPMASGTLQPQATGYPGQQMQQQQQFNQQQLNHQQFQQPVTPQYTGYPPQARQQQQQQQAPYQQPQQTAQQTVPTPAQAPAPRQRPQPTGMTSSAVADSLRGDSSSANGRTPPMPSERLYFMPFDNQTTYWELFTRAGASKNTALPADSVVPLLKISKLDQNVLADIWYAPFCGCCHLDMP